MKINKRIIIYPSLLLASLFTSCNNDEGGSSTGVKEITSDTTLTTGNFSSTSGNQNAVLINGKITANLSNLTLNKTGDVSTKDDKSSFYGTNAALLAKGGSTTVLNNLNVTTNADGANGVFAYGGKSSTKSGDTGDGTNITISNSTINTSKNASGGVMVAGHASLTANDCTVTTSGDSSAPIRSDRGGETMNISGGTYTSNGVGSPSVYATADITANNVKLTATHSEGVIVEGSNTVILNNCTLEDTNDKKNGKSTTYKNIFLYQSQSGDAKSGSDSFKATDCNITTHKGDDIYVTNQTSNITLKNNTFINDSTDSKYFLRAQADSWGESGKNGGNVTLSFDNQTVNGDIYIDSVSTLSWSLTNSSNFIGTIEGKNTATDSLIISLDEGSSITLTNDSYISGVKETSMLERINVNGHKLYKIGGGVIKE